MKMLQIFRPDDLIAAKEDIDALIAHQMPKRVPNGAMCFSGDFSVKNAGLDIAEVFHNPISIYNAICWFRTYTGFCHLLQLHGDGLTG